MVVQQDVDQVDVVKMMDGRNLELRIASPEDPLDKETRLEIESEEARHQRWRTTGIYVLAAVALVAMASISIYVILSSGFTPDDKAWAQQILTGLVTGFLGFVVGKAAAQ